jgi:HEAT repeat protein
MPVFVQQSDRYVQACFWVIIISIIYTIIITVLLFSSRLYAQYLLRRTKSLEHKYELLLTGIIFDEEISAEQKQKLHQHFKRYYLGNTFAKRVLRKQILTLYSNLTGSSQLILKELYMLMQLHKQAIKEMRSKDWSLQAEAVKELSSMNIKEALPPILKLTDNKNEVVQMEAQAAYVALNPENPFDFLDNRKVELNSWQQLNLEEKARKAIGLTAPLFTKWFYHPNASVAVFSIKMAVNYGQFDAVPTLLKLLSSPNQQILKQAIKALGILLATEAESTLLEMYPKVSNELQDEIINTLGKVETENSMVFLSKILYENNPTQAFKAGKALRYAGQQGDEILQQALQAHNSSIEFKVAKHMLDNRIEND